jgi:hypothetical protein
MNQANRPNAAPARHSLLRAADAQAMNNNALNREGIVHYWLVETE